MELVEDFRDFPILISISGSRGRLIWEKQLANFQNWEKWTGETKQSVLLLNYSKHGKYTLEQQKYFELCF